MKLDLQGYQQYFHVYVNHDPQKPNVGLCLIAKCKKIGQNYFFWQFCIKVPIGRKWHLLFKAHWKYFSKCAKDGSAGSCMRRENVPIGHNLSRMDLGDYRPFFMIWKHYEIFGPRCTLAWSFGPGCPNLIWCLIYVGNHWADFHTYNV